MQTLSFWILIEIKHFITDYCLQTAAMYEGKRGAKDWLLPLLRHAGTNAVGTVAVVFVLTLDVGAAFGAGLLDLVLHSIIDRTKLGVEKRGGNYAATAIDQILHQIEYFLFWMLFL